MSMLIGYHKTVEELQVIMQEKFDDNKMSMMALERKARELQLEMRSNPPKRETEDSRPGQMLELQKEGDRLMDQNAWLKSRIEEAAKSVEKDPKVKDDKVRLSLNDCLMLGIEPDAEEQSE